LQPEKGAAIVRDAASAAQAPLPPGSPAVRTRPERITRAPTPVINNRKRRHAAGQRAASAAAKVSYVTFLQQQMAQNRRLLRDHLQS
jgi:hypothetical protein